MKKTLVFLVMLIITHALLAKSNVNYLVWAEKVADSEMKHNPQLWMADFVKVPKWDYTQGLVAKAMMELYKKTNKQSCLVYVKEFAEYFVTKDGQILTYKISDYNIDRLNGGNFLFDIYAETHEERYLKAVKLLREQLVTHPRVNAGAFWHKKIYPHQLWLDGLYMGSPFYAHYASFFNEPSLFDDVTKQFIVADKFTFDYNTGLNYHGWDESRTQKWANPTTGQSPNFWSRSMGWYMMAMVDVLDFLPSNHPDRSAIIHMLNKLSDALLKYQDKKTGMWYQVTNFPKREGNYLESSGTAMFSYAMAKGAHNGYLSEKFLKASKKAFAGLIKYSTQTNPDGTVSITKACSVAGLGGNPYRDGSYEYYINEPIRNDDPKVIGPFIMAALELAK